MIDGLYRKYEVKKLTNPSKKVDAIVLEWDDPRARVGILAWAEQMRRDGFEQVYQDTMAKMKQFEGK